MWFLYFYGISTLICLIVLLIVSTAIANKLTREGITVKVKTTFSEKLSAYLPYFVPFVNVFLMLIIIFCQDELSKKTKQRVANRNEEQEHKKESTPCEDCDPINKPICTIECQEACPETKIYNPYEKEEQPNE